MIKKKFFRFSLVFFFFTSSLFAQEELYNSGIYFRIHTGIGTGKLKIKAHPIDQEEIEVGGESPYTSILFGTSIFDNFILHGEISRIHTSVFSDNSNEYSSSANIISSWGVGFTYYLLPYYTFLSASLRFEGKIKQVRKKRETNNFRKIEDEYDNGKGYSITLGKEWKTSKNWELGFAFIYIRDNFIGNNTSQKTSIEENTFANTGTASSEFWGILMSTSFN